MNKVIVITGASSGFGALTARALADAGHIVYAGMRETDGRNARRVEDARRHAAASNVDLRPVEMDVASQASVDAAVVTIISETGRLDVVIHNAGHMSFGPAEAFTPEQFAELYDVNVLSTQRVNRAALPYMRNQGEGLVVWVSSRGISEKALAGLAALEPDDADVQDVADAIVKVVDARHGRRPFRVHIDPSQDGAEIVNGMADRVRVELFRRIGLEELLSPRVG